MTMTKTHLFGIMCASAGLCMLFFTAGVYVGRDQGFNAGLAKGICETVFQGRCELTYGTGRNEVIAQRKEAPSK